MTKNEIPSEENLKLSFQRIKFSVSDYVLNRDNCSFNLSNPHMQLTFQIEGSRDTILIRNPSTCTNDGIFEELDKTDYSNIFAKFEEIFKNFTCIINEPFEVPGDNTFHQNFISHLKTMGFEGHCPKFYKL